MDFVVQVKEAATGKFAALVNHERRFAQLFVPDNPLVAEQFSLFWRARVDRGWMHFVLDSLASPAAEINIRLIGRSGVVTFDSRPEGAWSAKIIHELIESAELPYSVGLTIDSSMNPQWTSALYMWASIAAYDPEQGQPEVGVRTTLHDWHNSHLQNAIFPLFENSIGLDEGAARDLWSQAADTAKSLMPGRVAAA